VPLYRDEAVVLRTWKLGEADRILALLTAGHGQVRAVAKGVRRTRSKFGGRLEPTCHVAVQLHEGRGDLQIVTQAESLDTFPSLRGDPDRFADASALLEVAERLSSEGEGDRRRYDMLVGALRTLEQRPSPLLVPAFFLKALAHEGLAPALDACVRCQATDRLVAVDPGEGGVLCADCRRGRPLSESALAVLRAVLGGHLSTALEVEDARVCAEVDAVATDAAEYHLERRIRSRHVMDRA